MSEMLELNRLRDWSTLQEAADYLTRELDEEWKPGNVIAACEKGLLDMIIIHTKAGHKTRIISSELEALAVRIKATATKDKVVHDAGRIPVTKHDNPPGKMPNGAIGKLAIKAAWEIECETGRPALVDKVIVKLQSWVEQEDVLLEKINGGVSWQTNTCKAKDFDIGACGKALERWHKSRG